MSTPYTIEDLHAAIYRNQVDHHTALYNTQPGNENLEIIEDQVAEVENLAFPHSDNTKEDQRYFWKVAVPEGVKRYQRGKQIQEVCEVLTSRVSTQLRDADEEFPKDRAIVSPVECRSAGYVAGSLREYWVCLAYKKGSAQELSWFAAQAKEREYANEAQ